MFVEVKTKHPPVEFYNSFSTFYNSKFIITNTMVLIFITWDLNESQELKPTSVFKNKIDAIKYQIEKEDTEEWCLVKITEHILENQIVDNKVYLLLTSDPKYPHHGVELEAVFTDKKTAYDKIADEDFDICEIKEFLVK